MTDKNATIFTPFKSGMAFNDMLDIYKNIAKSDNVAPDLKDTIICDYEETLITIMQMCNSSIVSNNPLNANAVYTLIFETTGRTLFEMLENK